MKRICGFALLATCFGTASSQAALMTSWENSAGGFAAITGYSTTTGVTDGTYAAAVSVPAGWSNAFQSGYNNTYTPLLSANQVISVDVTPLVAIPNGKFLQIAWQLQTASGTSTADVGYTTINATGTTTVSFNYSTSVYSITPGTAWTELKIITNPSSGFAPGTVYFDNLQVTTVPEPAALALMGLGSLTLLRRDRRRA